MSEMCSTVIGCEPEARTAISWVRTRNKKRSMAMPQIRQPAATAARLHSRIDQGSTPSARYGPRLMISRIAAVEIEVDPAAGVVPITKPCATVLLC